MNPFQAASRVVFPRCKSDPIISLVHILQQLPTPVKGISNLYQGMNKDLLGYSLLSSTLPTNPLIILTLNGLGRTIRTIRTSKAGMRQEKNISLEY